MHGKSTLALSIMILAIYSKALEVDGQFKTYMFIITWLNEKALHVIVVNLSILWIILASFHEMLFQYFL